jgi:hypothetical protein
MTSGNEGPLQPSIAAASQGAKDVWNLVERASRATDAEAFVRQSQLQSIDLLGLLGELVRHQQQTYSGIRLGLKGSGSVLVNADPTGPAVALRLGVDRSISQRQVCRGRSLRSKCGRSSTRLRCVAQP